MAGFRVHFDGRGPVFVTAETPDAARKLAVQREPGARITKIKLDRVSPGPRGTRRITRGDLA
ncbi:hypothetical protein [Aureimonas mangrovi]|uniref:hypothetical protein n=1 Tax=Aureimonas mangrovi TaxID=2758041 RepID=UPI00163D5503|nr:hypothetical protein [Aureimonas mangrovi]